MASNSNRPAITGGFGDFGTKAETGATPAIELKAGDNVVHSRFGEGMVTDCLPVNGDHEVTVSFGQGVGVKRLLLSLAPLEKI